MSFEELEAELLETLAQVHDAVRLGRVDAARSAAKKCPSLLKSLRLEARTAPASKAEAYAVKLREHDLAVADANREIDKASSGALMGGRGASEADAAGGPAASAAARGRAAESTTKLAGGSSKLKAAHRQLEETIATAEGTLGELKAQRETMTRIQGRVAETDALATEANTITGRMSSFWGSLFSSSGSSSASGGAAAGSGAGR
jgi:hypothetical protein